MSAARPAAPAFRAPPRRSPDRRLTAGPSRSGRVPRTAESGSGAAGGAKAGCPGRASAPISRHSEHAHDRSRHHLRRLHAAPERARSTLALLVEARQALYCLGTARSGEIDDRPAGRGRREPPVCRRPRAPARPRGSAGESPGATAPTAPAGRRRPSCRRPTTPASGSSISKSCRLPLPMVQAALYQLVLDRKVGEYELARRRLAHRLRQPRERPRRRPPDADPARLALRPPRDPRRC